MTASEPGALPSCRSCGYPTHIGAPCNECGVVQTELPPLAQATGRSGMRVLLISGLFALTAPVTMVLALLTTLVTGMDAVTTVGAGAMLMFLLPIGLLWRAGYFPNAGAAVMVSTCVLGFFSLVCASAAVWMRSADFWDGIEAPSILFALGAGGLVSTLAYEQRVLARACVAQEGQARGRAVTVAIIIWIALAPLSHTGMNLINAVRWNGVPEAIALPVLVMFAVLLTLGLLGYTCRVRLVRWLGSMSVPKRLALAALCLPILLLTGELLRTLTGAHDGYVDYLGMLFVWLVLGTVPIAMLGIRAWKLHRIAGWIAG